MGGDWKDTERGWKIVYHGRTVVKYWPFLDFSVLWGHVILLLLGYNIPIADMGFSLSIVQMFAWLAASYAFGYCTLHRAYIIYNTLVSACINYHQHFGFGEYLTISRWIVVIIGAILLIAFIIHNINKHNMKQIEPKEPRHNNPECIDYRSDRGKRVKDIPTLEKI